MYYEIMKITVWNIKGRVGKSPIASELALRNDWAVATNEALDDVTIDDVLPEDRLLIVPEDEAFPDLDGYDIVFDLKGSLTKASAPSIKSALSQSDWVIVPTVALRDTLIKTNRTLEEIRDFKPELMAKTIVVATHVKTRGKFNREPLDGEQCVMIRQAIKQGTGLELPMLPIMETTAFEWAQNDGVSVQELIEGTKIDGTPFVAAFIANRFKTVCDQLTQINKHLIS